jgi:hypothetical protein
LNRPILDVSRKRLLNPLHLLALSLKILRGGVADLSEILLNNIASDTSHFLKVALYLLRLQTHAVLPQIGQGCFQSSSLSFETLVA